MSDEDMITEGTVREILEAVKMEIRKEDLNLLEEERRLREERERKLKYERTLNKRKWESLNQNIEQKSRRIAQYISRSIFVVVMLLVSSGALFGTIRWWGN